MIRYECDKCGAKLGANDPHRFIVKMEVYAAAEHIHVDEREQEDLSGQLRGVIEQLRNADPSDMEDRTYRAFRFDVCDRCRQDLLARPLGR